MSENKALTVAQSSVPSVVHTPLPAHLQKEKGAIKGTEQLAQYIIPPRLKIVQDMAQPPYDEFTAGTTICIASQGIVLVSEHSYDTKHKPLEVSQTPFYVVPLFFYPEFTIQNPLKAKGILPFIRERSLDPNSSIAMRAKQRHEFACPELAGTPNEKEVCKYVEHLNFMVMLLNHELFGTPVVMTFMRGEHKYGRTFADKINARRTDIFGCVFEARSAVHTNSAGNSWFGFNIDNPNPEQMSPWVEDANLCADFERLHETFKDGYEKQIIQVNYDDDDAQTVQGAPVVNNAGEY